MSEIALMLILFSDPNCMVLSHFMDNSDPNALIIFERICALNELPRRLAKHWLQCSERYDYGYGASLGDGFINWIDFVRGRHIYLEFQRNRCVTYSKGKMRTRPEVKP